MDPAKNEAAFSLVAAGKAAPICIPPGVEKVVQIAAQDLAEDIERVTGVRPEVLNTRPEAGPRIEVFISSEARDHWETFRLSANADTLTIQGSDKRALAFGIYDISRRIGVSPWNWWADVPVVKRTELCLSLGTEPAEAPNVKYRGVFLNDEGWGLRPWAAKTFEPEVGNIGPKTYARIFELLLRLRANTIWPAMHPGTTPFHQMPGNAQVADDYAIVVGSSHAEPMLRNNVGEWKKPHHEYNFLAHRDTVLGYWEERVKQRANGASTFTLGMRGIHDSPIMGPKNQAERIKTLETVFREQRNMLEQYLGAGSTARNGGGFSQMFCPYKEVLSDYKAGLRVPEDVTLVWPDDNFGYIRHFPTDRERKRSGGSGVYYHLSYLGAPLSWLWFDSLPPALVWSEMTKAYEQGSREIWIANVGDLKGNEQSTEWFLDLAWHAGKYGPESGQEFLTRMASRDFGAENGKAIAGLWSRHQSLAFARKPEHLQWNLPNTAYQPNGMTGDEIKRRLEAYNILATDASRLVESLPANVQDPAFQLITYPIACARAANERYFHLELVRRGDPSGSIEVAKSADQTISDLTRRYNESVSGGKWRGIMSAEGISPKDWTEFQPVPFAKQLERLSSSQPTSRLEATAPEPHHPVSKGPTGFVECDGVVSMNAGHYSDRKDVRGGGWRSVPGLGRTGSAVTVLPTTTQGAPSLSYRFLVTSGGPATLHLRLLPTHPVDNGKALRIAYAIDSDAPTKVTARDFDPGSKEWKMQVMANATTIRSKLSRTLNPGWHTLRVVSIDPGVVLDKIVLDLGGLRPSYDGPAETRND
ncbi:MAG: glycosyl hydrolase 115 family protein [Verrucomicrobiae bacterium]|nr:glycosyl hydrolase 115 family protein [Verrucomicrobiae bacterium]